jgi:hypothetical protein
MESVNSKIEKYRQKQIKKKPEFESESATADVRDFLNKNKKHHVKVENEDEEFDLEEPSTYEKEAENYTLDTLDAYSTAMEKHSLAE